MRLTGRRGEVTGAVILLPLVVTMVFLVIHAALVYHARSVVAAAAEDAARAAQLEDGTAADGRAVADALLRGSSELLPDPVVSVERGATTVEVTVRATVRGPIPWLRPTVAASAGGPVERFIPESER
jgi:Flp pilus assembly protein TadG